jgi:hypothetical protein
MTAARPVFRTVPLLLAVALALASLTGCSSDSQVLAVVAGGRITVADFNEAAAESWAQFPFPPDSARGALLERLVQDALLAEAGRRSPDTIDSLVRDNREQVERQVITTALIREMVPREIPVSEAELRRLYAQRDSVSHVLVAYVVDEPTARIAMQELERGADFGTVSMRYSLPRSVPPGGDAGWVAPGTLIEELDHAVSAAPVGRNVGPLRVQNQGWFLFRVVERKKQDQPPFESEMPRLRTSLQQRKQQRVWLRALDRLRDSYRVEIDPHGLAVLFRHLNTPSLIAGMGGESAPPPPTAEELRTVIGRWDGGGRFRGAFTLADAFADLDSGRGERPNPSMTPALEQWVRGRILERVALIEGRRRHLDQVPANARQIRRLTDEYLASGVRNQEVTSRAVATAEDVRAEFASNAALFSELVSARFQHLTVPDSASAARIVALLDRPQAGAAAPRSLRDAVMASSAGMQVQEAVIAYPSDDPVWGILEGAVTGSPDGTFFPPMRVPEGWRIVQLAGKEVKTPQFEELPFEVQQMLAERVTERMRERRLRAVADSLSRTIPVTTWRDRLDRLPWPPRGASMPQAMPMAG